MGEFVARHLATRAGPGNVQEARLNHVGEIVGLPYLWQLSLEGRLFMAGHGLEETATDSEASLNETKPNFALTAPASETVVVPLSMTIRMHDEGGATPQLYATYVQESKSVLGAGTAHTPLNLLGGLTPKSARAQAQHTLTGIDTFVDGENVMLTRRGNILDDLITAEMVATDANLETPGLGILEYTWEPKYPIMLYQGSSILFYMVTGTSDSKWSHTAVWAELPSDPYVV